MIATAKVLAFAASCAALPAKLRPDDRRIYVDGSPLHMKGVNWNPVPSGKMHPSGIEFLEHVEMDARLMAEAGINVIRTYEPITDLAVLDELWKNGIQVINTVYSNSEKPLDTAAQEVNLVKHHPAILMWAVGNEWNYKVAISSWTNTPVGKSSTRQPSG